MAESCASLGTPSRPRRKKEIALPHGGIRGGEIYNNTPAPPARVVHPWKMFSDEQLAVPSADDLAIYDQTFASRNIGGFVDGNTAREIFMASQLPNDVLSAIWQLSDMDGDSQLSHPEFRIGMMPTGLEPRTSRSQMALYSHL